MRSTSVIAAALCTSVCGCIGASLPKTPGAGGPPWREITTEHFVIDTNLDPEVADATARQLENLRNVMIEAVFEHQPAPSPKLRVLALRSDEYGHYATKNVGVFMSSVVCQPVLATSPGGEWGTMQNNIRVHELAHYVSSLYMSIYNQPRWFAEGFAEYLETLRYDEKTGSVEIGRPPLGFEYLEFTSQAFLDELWGWDEAKNQSRTDRLYETSWAVVHWLFDERKDDAVRFEDALAHGKNAQKAWKEIFGDLDEHAMSEVVGKYVTKHKNKIIKANVPAVKVTLQSRPLGDADVYAFRAMLYMSMHGARSDEEVKKLAMSNIDEAVRLEPTNFWANVVSYAYFDRLPMTIDIAKHAAESQNDNWLAWTYYADVIGAMHGPVAERRAAAKRAVDLAPTGMSLASASRAEGEAGDWKAALSLAEQAVQSRSWSIQSVPAYASALAHSSRCDDAHKVIDQFGENHKRDAPKLVGASVDEVAAVCGAR
jgi:hypothetical protein